jgi:hypothetical protein
VNHHAGFETSRHQLGSIDEQEVAPSSKARMAKLLAIMNEKPKYNIPAFAKRCQEFYNPKSDRSLSAS